MQSEGLANIARTRSACFPGKTQQQTEHKKHYRTLLSGLKTEEFLVSNTHTGPYTEEFTRLESAI